MGFWARILGREKKKPTREEVKQFEDSIPTAEEQKSEIQTQENIRQKIKDTYKEQRPREILEQQIKTEESTSTKMGVISKASNIGDAKPRYEQLLKTKVNDQKLIQSIIEHRELMLRHRMTAEVNCFENGKVIGTFEIAHILIEQSGDVYSFFVGHRGVYFTDVFESFMSRLSGWNFRDAVLKWCVRDRRVNIDDCTLDFTFG